MQFDQIVFQNQSLSFAGGDNIVKISDLIGHTLYLGGVVAHKILAHPIIKIFRLTYVNDLAGAVFHNIYTGQMRQFFNFYNVKTIIRVGSCGSFSPDLHVRDIVVAMGACTNGNYASQYNLPGTFCPIADFDLVRRAAEECEKLGVNYRVGNILSSDMFYDDANSGMQWAKMGVLGVEMESAALYCNAARAGKKALCICTVSDSFIYPEENTTAEERQNSFTKMMEIALSIAE